MRIRNRAVPLPLSLLSPVRLLQLSADSPPPADDLLIGAASVSPVPIEHKGYGNEKNKEKREDNNHTSKQRDTGAASDNGGVLPPPPPTPSNVTATEGRWCEGDKAIPFKKRKVNLEFEMSKVGASTTKMKSKTNKKCPLDHYNSSDSDDNNEDENGRKKKRKSKKLGKTRTLGGKYTSSKEGRTLMEGSRCSRVNGRGWRCLQPTLVGYSLCEHHLGKGRLRSISAVRVGAASEKIPTAPASSTPPRASEAAKIRCSDPDEEVSGKKKTRKVGMVKARSLSSLLCQPETKVQVHPAHAAA